MTDHELRIWSIVPIRVAITDPYLSQIRITAGYVAYTLDSGHIPIDVRLQCDRPRGEEEMQR